MAKLPSFRRSRSSMPSLAVSGGTATEPAVPSEPVGESYGRGGGSGFGASTQSKYFVAPLGQSSLPLPKPAHNTRAQSRQSAPVVVVDNSDDEADDITDKTNDPPLTPVTSAIRGIKDDCPRGATNFLTRDSKSYIMKLYS